MNYYTCAQAAEIAHCKEYTIREAIKQGTLPAYKPGKSYLVAAEDLEKWIRSTRVKVS